MHILWLKTELLHPIDKGGRIRTYHMLRELCREHHITYLTLDDGTAAPDAVDRAAEYCHELVRIPHQTRAKFTRGFYFDLTRNLVSGLPYFIMKYESAAMRREIEKQVGTGRFDVVVCDFLMPSVNMPARVDCATVLFQHNVEAMIWKRHYEVQRNPVKRLYLYGQWLKASAFERKMCRRFDQVVAVSRKDCETMQSKYGLTRIADIPTGVDTEYFRPSGKQQRASQNLVFTGSMDWLPNEDAMQYFIREIMPKVRQAAPNVTLTIVGRNPYQSLLEVSKRDASVIVTGRVEDVRPYIEQATAYIVPIRVGGGTRLKIYEALAMEKPVISTTIGAEGLPLRDGREILLADTPDDFSAAVVRVLTDDRFAGELGKRAGQLVREHFGWKSSSDQFAEICRNVVSRRLTTPDRTNEPLQAVS